MQFPATQESISEAFANDPRGIGGHLEDDLSKSEFGIPVGELPFDPEKDDFEDVMLDSMMEAVTGQLHVEQTIAMKPHVMTVVLDERNRDESKVVSIARSNVARVISRSLGESIPDPADRVFEYSYGEPDEEMGRFGERIGSDRELLDICKSGLTFVVSDFVGLKSLLVAEGGLDGSVAVKVNPAFGLKIPSGLGVISLGGSKELNTNKPDQLGRANSMLYDYHTDIRSQLEQAGLEVAQVVVTPRSMHGFNVQSADVEIADAVSRAYGKSKH